MPQDPGQGVSSASAHEDPAPRAKGRTCGGGARAGDLRGEADGAVAALPPEADVVVLAGEVGLAGGHRRGGRQVVVEGGDGADLKNGWFITRHWNHLYGC